MKSTTAKAIRLAAKAQRSAPHAAAALAAAAPERLLNGTRRYLRRWEKADRAERLPRTASLVTAPATYNEGGDAPLARYAAQPAGPKTLCTKDGRVVLAGSNLSSLRGDQEADALLRGLPTPLLSDGRRTKSPQELEQFRQEIIDYFHKTFTLSEKLHEVFTNVPAFFEKHEQLRHPPIFYLGHTASFYVNKLHLGKFIDERIDPVLEMQMAVGVDEMSWDDLDSNSYVWPSGAEARADEAGAAEFLQKVLDFRREVRKLVDELLKTQPMEWPIDKDSFWWIITMGIEHERIHLETSSVIHRQANLECVQPVAVFPVCDRGRFHHSPNSVAAGSMPPNKLVAIPAGSTRLGRSWEGTKTYGWDNEFGKEVHADVPAFSASEFLVSNREYLDFVEAGGYSTQRYWTEEGWNWVVDMKPSAPRFWRQSSDGYRLRTLCQEVAMPWDWPVEVCHNEAAAFCKYLSEKTGKSFRLPMEDEYLRLRDSVQTDLQDSAHGPAWGSQTPGNVNLAYWGSSCPVDTFKSSNGVYDVLGNVWQHSATHIDVLEGFSTHPLYDDFTTPTVGGKHSRIMGGSWMSTGANGATRDSRYGFRRHFYQHAGFRYIASNRSVVNSASPYESDRGLCDAFRFHFDAPVLGANYHSQLADVCADLLQGLGRPVEGTRALEVGCGPGRVVLELAKRGFSTVHGADRTAKAFQCTAQRLFTEGGRLRWTNYLEGELLAKRELGAAELGLSEACAQAMQFFQTPDFAAIDAQRFHGYDLVVCAQPGVLSSTGNALGVLAGLHKLLKPGGLLVIGTQYEWPALTATASGGAAAAATTGEEVLSAVLRPWFEPASGSVDLEYTRAETLRKLERGVQHVTCWKRRQEELSGVDGADAAGAMVDPSSPALRAEFGGQAMYDEESTVGQYLDFHYGPSADYPVSCARRCVEVAQALGVPLGRALEVGGGPGRAGVELSRAFSHVDSGDYSNTFVELGRRLLEEGELRWRSLVDRTAGKMVDRNITAQELQVGNVTFSHMDAQALPAGLSGYDLVCGFNLIDRLAEPRAFLREAKSRLNKGGLLVISSPYTWLEEFTPKDRWLGGFKYGDNDGPTTYEGLKEFLLAEGFEEAAPAEDLLFRIEELGNGRKNQQTTAQMTFWRLP